MFPFSDACSQKTILFFLLPLSLLSPKQKTPKLNKAKESPMTAACASKSKLCLTVKPTFSSVALQFEAGTNLFWMVMKESQSASSLSHRTKHAVHPNARAWISFIHPWPLCRLHSSDKLVSTASALSSSPNAHPMPPAHAMPRASLNSNTTSFFLSSSSHFWSNHLRLRNSSPDVHFCEQRDTKSDIVFFRKKRNRSFNGWRVWLCFLLLKQAGFFSNFSARTSYSCCCHVPTYSPLESQIIDSTKTPLEEFLIWEYFPDIRSSKISTDHFFASSSRLTKIRIQWISNQTALLSFSFEPKKESTKSSWFIDESKKQEINGSNNSGQFHTERVLKSPLVSKTKDQGLPVSSEMGSFLGSHAWWWRWRYCHPMYPFEMWFSVRWHRRWKSSSTLELNPLRWKGVLLVPCCHGFVSLPSPSADTEEDSWLFKKREE